MIKRPSAALFTLLLLGSLLISIPNAHAFLTDWNSIPQAFKDVLKRVIINEEICPGCWQRMSWMGQSDDGPGIPSIVESHCYRDDYYFGIWPIGLLYSSIWRCGIVHFGYEERYWDTNVNNKDYDDAFVNIEYSPGSSNFPAGFYVHMSVGGSYHKVLYIDKDNVGAGYYFIDKPTQSPYAYPTSNLNTPMSADSLMSFGGSYDTGNCGWGLLAWCTRTYDTANYADGSCLSSATPPEVQTQLQRVTIWVPNDLATSPNAGKWFPIPYDQTHCKQLGKASWDGYRWREYYFGFSGDLSDISTAPRGFTEATVTIKYEPILNAYIYAQVGLTGWLPLQSFLDAPSMASPTNYQSPKDYYRWTPIVEKPQQCALTTCQAYSNIQDLTTWYSVQNTVLALLRNDFDFGRGVDAGNTIGTAMTLSPFSETPQLGYGWLGGTIGGNSGYQDTDDYYQFYIDPSYIAAGYRLVLNAYGSANFPLTLYSPSLTTKATGSVSAYGISYLFQSGDSGGTWYLDIQSSGAAGPYLLNLYVTPPPPPPTPICRTACPT